MAILNRVLALILTLAAAGAPAAAAAPSWAQALLTMRVPDYGLDTTAVCLLDESRIVVSDNGDIREYRRVAYKILAREGLAVAWVRLFYDQDTRVSNLKVWNLKPGGIVHEAAQKDSIELQVAGGDVLFADTKSLVLMAPQVEVGSIVAYEYERRHRPFVLQSFWTAQKYEPVLRTRFEVQLPTGWKIHYRMLRHANAEAKETAGNYWVWELNDLPAIPVEEGMPSLASVGALLVVGYSPGRQSSSIRGETWGNWDDFAAWLTRLNDPRFAPSNEMTVEAQRLGSTQAVAEFVQKKIRYVAIEIGIGGYQPHLAQETFRNQYGDCKDKVTLLRGMMKALNREVHPVLINADRGGLEPEFPSPLYFNHMIAAIPIAEGEFAGSAVIDHPQAGRLLLFDPTDEHTPLGRLPFVLQGTKAMLVLGDRGFVIDTPISAAADNRLQIDGNFRIAENGSLSGDLARLSWGELAARETDRLKHQDTDQRVAFEERETARALPGQRITGLTVSDLSQTNPVTEKFSISAPNFAQRSGDLLLIRPAVLNETKPLPALDESRTHPYVFSAIYSIRATFNFQLPDGYTIEALPAVAEMDLPFAYWKSEVVPEGQGLRYTSLYEIRKLEVPAEDFGRLRRFEDLVSRSLRNVAILNRSK